MSNFNKVFTAVKKKYNDTGAINGKSEFQQIATEIGLTIDKLHFYLDCIEQTGLVNYSAANYTISLTEKGKNKNRVFPEQDIENRH